MKNPLKTWRERRRQKEAQKQQRELLQTWKWLEQLFHSGVISFSETEHRLFITQSLATVLMAHGTEGWLNSIHSIYQYTYWKISQKAWEDYIQKEELTAVRDALRQNKNLTREDIERIKWARRQEIALSDTEPPKVEPFEFFIIPDSIEAKVEPLAVGYYDPETKEMEVASWNDVKNLLQGSRSDRNPE